MKFNLVELQSAVEIAANSVRMWTPHKCLPQASFDSDENTGTDPSAGKS